MKQSSGCGREREIRKRLNNTNEYGGDADEVTWGMRERSMRCSGWDKRQLYNLDEFTTNYL